MNAGAQKCVTHRVKNTPGVGPAGRHAGEHAHVVDRHEHHGGPRTMSIGSDALVSAVEAARRPRSASGSVYGRRACAVPVGETTVAHPGPQRVKWCSDA